MARRGPNVNRGRRKDKGRENAAFAEVKSSDMGPNSDIPPVTGLDQPNIIRPGGKHAVEVA
jgi:hypothetical protein